MTTSKWTPKRKFWGFFQSDSWSFVFPSRYANIMVKSDFISNHLATLPFSELIFAIKTLETQKNLIAELKSAYLFSVYFLFVRKQPMFPSDEILYINEEECKEILLKWQKCSQEIAELQSDPQYQEEFLAYKGSLAVSFVDVRKFSDKLWEFQKSLVQYHRICNLLTKLKHQVQKYFLKEFHKRVQLVCDDISLAKNGLFF